MEYGIVVGKNFGSKLDRDYFKNKMRNDIDYKQNFYSIISQLPENFYIGLNQQTRYITEFTTEPQLAEFILTDDLKYYLIIGREFSPDDIELSENNIVDTIIENFTYLYPIYDMIKYKIRL